MHRITTLHVPGWLTLRVHKFAHAIGHATLIAGVDLVVAGLGLPLGLHVAVGALIFLGIEAVLHRR
jgi:hypothetical protein